MDLRDIANLAAIVTPFLTSSSQKKNNERTISNVNDSTQEFIDQASASLEEAAARAEELILAGQEQAAAALIEGTKLGISEIWRGASLGEDALREFIGQANQFLKPIIKQGRYADNEIASMLGIPNSKGKLVPFDDTKLSNTPGYKFRYEWGKRAVENSAVGRYLSGQSAQELTQFGQGLASEYFDTRVSQLDSVANRGAQAASQASNNLIAGGGALAQLFGNAGQQAGNLQFQQGAGLAEIFTNSALNRAQLITNAESTLANLGLGAITANNNASIAAANSTNNFLSDITQAITGLPSFFNSNNIPAVSSISGNSGAPGTVSITNPINTSISNSGSNNDIFSFGDSLWDWINQ